jgi:hypothetical protein
LQAHLQFYFKGIKCLAAKELAKPKEIFKNAQTHKRLKSKWTRQ